MPGKCVRGDIYDVNLDPARGSEPAKVRPCVVIQNDVGNKYSTVTIVAAVTGAENVPKRYPIDVPIPRGEAGLAKDSVVQCNLIRCVDEERLGKFWGKVRPETLARIDQALLISLGIKERARTA